MIELNLFETIPPSNDPNIVRIKRRTTRSYLVLLFTALFILVLYASLKEETITSVEKSPSVSNYTELFLKYPLTLQCQCSHIVTKYKKLFSQIEPQFHQICSSVFISPEWFESMTYSKEYSKYTTNEFDFRKRIRMQFQIVAKLCILSKKMLNTSLSIFGDTDFITADVISRAEFNVRIETIIEQLRTAAANEFMNVLKLIEIVNHGNQLATLYSFNWKFVRKYLNHYEQAMTVATLDGLLTLSQTYGEENCSCGRQSNCSEATSFDLPIVNQSSRQILTGFRVGCMILDSVLQSSLVCLYNQQCLALLQASMYYSKPVPAEILTYSPLFPPNTTIETILSRLFVSEWLLNTSFDRYFNECAPQSCQYSYSIQYNPIYIVTMLMGLFGGLTKGIWLFLYLIEFIIIKFIDRRKKKNQVAPHSHLSNIAVVESDNNTIEIGPVPATIIIQVTKLYSFFLITTLYYIYSIFLKLFSPM